MNKKINVVVAIVVAIMFSQLVVAPIVGSMTTVSKTLVSKK